MRHAGMGLAASALPIPAFDAAAAALEQYTARLSDAEDRFKDEAYWSIVRSAFRREGDFINLENGYFSPQPEAVRDYTNRQGSHINASSSYFMWREQEAAIEGARTALAGLLGVQAEELALTRNTTESLNTVIAGFPWKQGDEVVIGDQDYGSMNEAFMQNARRYGFTVRTAAVPLLPENDAAVVQAYVSLIGPHTRMLHLTHLINLSGQVIPVATIAKAARQVRPDICVVVDAAHSVAQLDFKLPELEADIVAASLHKWLCNPLGAGMLWMKAPWIPQIWPLMADTSISPFNIRRFEHQGTRPIHHLMSIPEAIAFHRRIGAGIKAARLRYLMERWAGEAAKMPSLRLLTPWNQAGRNSAIATVAHLSLSPGQLAHLLFEKHRIFTVAIEHPVINGVRITPHLYTRAEDCDALVAALKSIG